MTPAINVAKKAKINFQIHEYEHDPDAESYGEEAAAKMGIAAERVFKTLVVARDEKELFVAVVPVSSRLDLKAFAKALGLKKVAMADKNIVHRVTGYVLGGCSPLGQKKRLKTVIDKSAQDYDSIFVSAGRRGLDIELNPDDLAGLTGAQFKKITVTK
ncbi:Cys-tRNA(Pro) deacylase [Maridesulfovibrio bastinii]|uniref:Cys-tRNA(Pro) deacylase n=1 Tax=Maridesulfovibrio bastinii TaxID=47157 RepID=UPI00041FB5BA|nr:Cys-tRNA(Pro) deacylase [Maridesulfovibrio bastinii]